METQELAKTKKIESVAKEGSVEDSFPEIEGAEEIVVLAYHRDQLPVTLRPCFDSTGRVYTGQGKTGHYETLSEEQKRNMNYVITPETTVVLTDGKVFSMNNPIDKANWKWVRRHAYLALDKSKGESSRTAVFYLHNPIAEATKRVTSSKLRDKARYVIQYESNREQLVRAAKVMGSLGADAMSDNLLQDFLLQQTDIPGLVKAVLDAIQSENSESSKAKILYTELQKYRLIQRGDGGLFRFGGEKGIPLGHTPELVLEFMMNEKNHDTVTMMKNTLGERKQIPIE